MIYHPLSINTLNYLVLIALIVVTRHVSCHGFLQQLAGNPGTGFGIGQGVVMAG